jgi:hypothetical protein
MAKWRSLQGYKRETLVVRGPGEHDTCHSPDYYFSSSMWAWRGMLEFSRWLRATAIWPALRATLEAEAVAFALDITAALDVSIVRDNVTGEALFVPPIAGSGQQPFASMTVNTESSYSNFRYYAEMLSSGFMNVSVALVLSNFREQHGGTLSGMTRYEDHLDDSDYICSCLSVLSHFRQDAQQALLLLFRTIVTTN